MRIEKLFPACKDYLWGGNKLKENYGKQTDLTPCAESWELSFHKDGQTLLVDGTKLSDKVTAIELGENVTEFSFFPVLIKFIDRRSGGRRGTVSWFQSKRNKRRVRKSYPRKPFDRLLEFL